MRLKSRELWKNKSAMSISSSRGVSTKLEKPILWGVESMRLLYSFPKKLQRFMLFELMTQVELKLIGTTGLH